MKTRKYIYSKLTFFLGLILLTTLSCERGLSDEVEFATFSKTGDIFIDSPIALGSDFYLPFEGSKATAWSIDEDVKYLGTASMRFDVPNANDPEGGFAGAIFRIDGVGRDLTDFDALTFWARASQGATIGEFGFGEDFNESKFVTTLNNISLGTAWQKIIIPIPDASKLINEIGMFKYSAGTQETGGLGYTFWVDELKFEKLGTLAQPQPKILNGEDVVQQTFSGANFTLFGTQTFNTATGDNVTVNVAPSYFDFTSSDTNIAIVNELGIVTVFNSGSSKITAALGGVAAQGSLALESLGNFQNAPDPTLNQADVLSLYSDFYTGITGFNPGAFAGGNTGNIQIQTLAGNDHVSYESIDFVGLQWDQTVNVSGFTNVHLDVQLVSPGGSSLIMELIDFGPDDADNGLTNTGGDGTAGGFNVSSQLTAGQWVGIDIPLSAFILPTGGGGAGSPNLNNIGFVVFVSPDGASFLVDNIYFY